MSDLVESLAAEVTEPVAAWLLPLDGEPCGADLEYDPEFLELVQAAAGKPETQFSAAEPPVWSDVRDRAASLLGRTRDLRVAVQWGRAKLNVEGLPGLLPTLQLLQGLLDNFWDSGLHPALDPDDSDAFARISALGSLDKLDGLLGDLRQALVVPDRRLGGLRVRDIELALDRLPPRPDESPRSLGELHGLFTEFGELCETVRGSVGASMRVLKQLQRVMNDRFGTVDAVEVKTLRLMLDAVQSALPAVVEPALAGSDGETGAADAMAATGQPGGARGGALNRIDSRKDAIRAIGLICDYLERSEPTNPAQWLLRRAERLIEANFLQLMRELAPDAMADVARVMGVNPDDVGSLS